MCVAGTFGLFVGVLGGPRESLACGRTNAEVVAGRFVGLWGRPVDEGVLVGTPGPVTGTCGPPGLEDGPD